MKNIPPNIDGVYVVGIVTKVCVDRQTFVWEPDETRSAVTLSRPIPKREVQDFFDRSHGNRMQRLPQSKQQKWLRRLGRGRRLRLSRRLVGGSGRLLGGGGFLDPALGHAGGDRPGHAAHGIDLFDQLPGLFRHLRGQAFDIVAARQRIDDIRHAGFFLQDQLGVARDAGRKIRRQRDGFVEGVRVQTLRVTAHGRQRFEARARDIVERILLRQTPARRLRVRAERARLRVLWIKPTDHFRPDRPGRAQLGDCHEEVFPDRPEEREARRKRIDVDARRHPRLQILQTVRQRVSQLEIGGRARFLHVVTRDRDAVKLRHLRRREGEDIGEHQGLMYHTLGQRQGLGIGGLKNHPDAPWFVAGKDLERNVLIAVQGIEHPLLYKEWLTTDQVFWVNDEPSSLPLQCKAKVRYRQDDQDCTIYSTDTGYRVEFSKPQRAITPGQSVVFYLDDNCLGGGVIEQTGNLHE